MARRRFPLRWKIALFAAGLIVLSVGAISVVTVYRPWREKLATQRRLAINLVTPLATSIVRMTAQGPVWNDKAVEKLIENAPALAPTLGLEFALLYDQGGALSPASLANTEALGRRAPQLLALYLRDKERCLQVLAAGVRGLRTQTIALKEPDREAPVGKLVLGYSTAAIDAEARAALLNELLVLAGTLLLGGVGAILVGGRLARPLDELAAAMGKARTGDFSEELLGPAQARDEIGDLARAYNEMMQGLRERERLRGTLGRYVSGDVAQRILEEQDDNSLPGELRRATVLFLDVRGFTAVAEKLAPREVVSLLNAYFSIVVEAVARSGGTVNKFIGDAALCIWGAPREAQDAELSAVRAALEIQAGAKALGERRAAQGLLTVGLGIGINTGEVLAGNLGSRERLEYTVIGDAVNTAQRLESLAKAGEVLVSEEVYRAVSARILAEPREPVLLKGKAQPVALWRVLALTGAQTEAA